MEFKSQQNRTSQPGSMIFNPQQALTFMYLQITKYNLHGIQSHEKA